jgi:hypothetical protein
MRSAREIIGQAIGQQQGRQSLQASDLKRWEPEEGFEPSTFRLRVGCFASAWMAPEGSGLLTLEALSVQTAPDGSRRIVWMIKWMIKAHPTENRMARQAAGPIRPLGD